MKKLLLLICVCTALSCKKDSNDVLDNKSFTLQSATVSPGILINGKLETNYMAMAGSSACLNYDYTLTFKNDGTYTLSSRGPLCDMVANTNSQKWTKKGDQVTLTHAALNTIVATLKGNKLSYTLSSPIGIVNYTVVYEFIAK